MPSDAELRREADALAETMESLLAGRSGEAPTREAGQALARDLLPALERYATCLLPLVEDDPAALERELHALARRMQRRPQPGYTFWLDVPGWGLWWLVHVLGAYAVRREAFAAVRAVLGVRHTDLQGRVVPLAPDFLGAVGGGIAETLAPPPPEGRTWALVAWGQLVHLVSESPALRDAALDLFVLPGDPRRALGEWAYVQALGLGLAGEDANAVWSIATDLSAFTRRLHDDRGLRERLAREGLGVTIEELDAHSAEAVARAHRLGALRPGGPVRPMSRT